LNSRERYDALPNAECSGVKLDNDHIVRGHGLPARCALQIRIFPGELACAARSPLPTTLDRARIVYRTADTGIRRALPDSIIAGRAVRQRTGARPPCQPEARSGATPRSRLVRGIGARGRLGSGGAAVCAVSVYAMVDRVHFLLHEGWATAAEVDAAPWPSSRTSAAVVGRPRARPTSCWDCPRASARSERSSSCARPNALGVQAGTRSRRRRRRRPVRTARHAVGWAEADGARPPPRRCDWNGASGVTGSSAPASGAASPCSVGSEAARTPCARWSLSRARKPFPRFARERALAARRRAPRWIDPLGTACDRRPGTFAAAAAFRSAAAGSPTFPSGWRRRGRADLPHAGLAHAAAGAKAYICAFLPRPKTAHR